MPLSREQRQRAMDCIAAGDLRLDQPTMMWAGRGTGQTCSGCKDTIGPNDVEYEADFADGGRYYFHFECAGFWHAERQRRENAATQEGRSIIEQSRIVREQAVKNAKHSAQLRDQADVLLRQSEDVIDKARQAKPGQPPGA
jgi:hypothetical protein